MIIMDNDNTQMQNNDKHSDKKIDIKQMPTEELRILAGQLMLTVPPTVNRDELIGIIEDRLKVIDAIPRQALIDIVVWSHRPISQSADKLTLIREISQIKFTRYEGLSHRGLIALAKLKGLSVQEDLPTEKLRRILMDSEGISGWISRKRRELLAKVIGKLIDEDSKTSREYQFLPEKQQDNSPSLQKTIEQQGVVGGIASKLRGAADDYINAKLDEIERRIDQKLDDIDRRLAEWRDQEIANRLKIIKITLIASAIIAFISLIYSYLKMHV